MPLYTSQEYQLNLHDEKWTKQATDHLFDLCNRFDLRWVVVHDRFDYTSYGVGVKPFFFFKLLLTVYKCLHCLSPPFLSDLLTLYQPDRVGLRSSDDKLLLSIPTGSNSLKDRSFCIAGPKLWNSTPINIKNAPSIAIFRKQFKALF